MKYIIPIARISIAENRKYLGEFYTCDAAVREAKKTYEKSNSCKSCSPACHTS